MGVITKPTTFADATIPTAAQFNGDFDTIYNEFNGNIENANVKAGAAIAEAKIAFDTTSGHSHNGTDSKLITVNRGFAWWIDGTLTADTSNRLYARYLVPENMTIVKAWAVVETAPTGADLLIDIYLNGTSIWASTTSNRLTVSAGATTGNRTSFDTTAITAGNYLDIYIDQVGSTIAGAGLAVTLECTQ